MRGLRLYCLPPDVSWVAQVARPLFRERASFFYHPLCYRLRNSSYMRSSLSPNPAISSLNIRKDSSNLFPS